MNTFLRRQRAKRFVPVIAAIMIFGALPFWRVDANSPASKSLSAAIGVSEIGHVMTFTSPMSGQPHTPLPSGTAVGNALVSVVVASASSQVICAAGWTKQFDTVADQTVRTIGCSTIVSVAQRRPAAAVVPPSQVLMATFAFAGADPQAPVASAATGTGMLSPTVTGAKAGSMLLLVHSSAWWHMQYVAPLRARMAGSVTNHQGAQVATAMMRVTAPGSVAPGSWSSKGLAQGTARVLSSTSITLALNPQAVTPAPTTTTVDLVTTTNPPPTTSTAAPNSTTTTNPPVTTTTAPLPTTTTFSPDPTPVDKARPFSNASPWNTPTAGGTAWFDTPSVHQLPDGSTRHWWVNTDSVGVWWSSPTDPIWTFDLPDYVAPAWHRNRTATTLQMRAPANLVAGSDVDHILAVADPLSGDYVELWQASVDPATHTVTNLAGTPGWAIGNLKAGPGAGTMSNNDGVRAANFSWIAGLLTGADLTAGRIDHALVVALPNDVLKGGGQTGTGAWRAPATAWDAGYWNGPVQMGSRLGIPATTPKPTGLSVMGSMLFDALQKYGAFVGDFAGGPWPNFYADGRSLPLGAANTGVVRPLFAFWETTNPNAGSGWDGVADMEKLGPLMRVADYQP